MLSPKLYVLFFLAGMDCRLVNSWGQMRCLKIFYDLTLTLQLTAEIFRLFIFQYVRVGLAVWEKGSLEVFFT